jgi:hypothetical protein
VGLRRRPLVLSLAALLLAAGCVPRAYDAGQPAPPLRLVLTESAEPDKPWLGSIMHAVDRTSLKDIPGLTAVDFPTCGSAPIARPDGRVLAITAGWLGPRPSGDYRACNQGGGVGLRLFDLETWTWKSDEPLIRADSLLFGWSADGRRLYALATSDDTDEQACCSLWIITPDRSVPPVSAPVSFRSWYWLVAPDGSALYALGFHVDSSERVPLAADPTFLVAFDPVTGAEQGRMELPGVKMWQRRECPGGTGLLAVLPSAGALVRRAPRVPGTRG